MAKFMKLLNNSAQSVSTQANASEKPSCSPITVILGLAGLPYRTYMCEKPWIWYLEGAGAQRPSVWKHSRRGSIDRKGARGEARHKRPHTAPNKRCNGSRATWITGPIKPRQTNASNGDSTPRGTLAANRMKPPIKSAAKTDKRNVQNAGRIIPCKRRPRKTPVRSLRDFRTTVHTEENSKETERSY